MIWTPKTLNPVARAALVIVSPSTSICYQIHCLSAAVVHHVISDAGVFHPYRRNIASQHSNIRVPSPGSLLNTVYSFQYSGLRGSKPFFIGFGGPELPST